MKSISSYLAALAWPTWTMTDHSGVDVRSLLLGGSVVALVYAILYGGLRFARRMLPRLARHERTRSVLEQSIESVRGWTLFAVALYAGLQTFNLPPRADLFVTRACVVLIAFQLLAIASIWIRYLFRESPLVQGNHTQLRTMSGSLTSIAILACWVFAGLLLLDNFGFDVATILAGLGVGGIAIGLALQSVLGDMISSFTIGLDQPFEVGDFIVVDKFSGTVERVGLKTTRIRALSGELLIFPNSTLVNSNVQNFKRMQQRRIAFSIGVTYDTDDRSLHELPSILRAAVEEAPNTRFDRAHFARFGSSALEFEVVYYMLTADYNRYMDVQQAINFRIRKECSQRGIRFAFPTQTLHIPPSSVAKLQTAFLGEGGLHAEWNGRAATR